MLKLYDYFRSSAAYRVRIALNLKGLDYQHVGVHLLKDGGQQLAPDYARLNPQRLVPALDDGGVLVTQSLAILEYLEEVHPEPPLLPEDPAGRARVRALAMAIACDIHPLNNLRVLKYLTGPLAVDEAAKMEWYRHWIVEGFDGIEALLARDRDTGPYCHGGRPGLADACLVPQVFNARRFQVDLAPYPTIRRIEEACQALPTFERARPEIQPDAD
jgi:maleylacetoacetate isomerase